jgi:ABC-2 type transport system permease protein
MLWYKGWLETRFRLLFLLGFTGLILSVHYSVRNTVPTHSGAKSALLAMLFTYAILLMMAAAMLAGAGIATQPGLQASKGLHGSTLFTLSLPVSRLRLLATRAVIGWLGVAAMIAILCCGFWFVSPLVRTMATPIEVVEYAATLLACGSAIYGLSVLLATVLDDQWRVWGTMIAASALALLSSKAWLPDSIDIIRAIGKDSPLFTHTIPWTPMAFSLALAAAFFLAALKIVRTREY